MADWGLSITLNTLDYIFIIYVILYDQSSINSKFAVLFHHVLPAEFNCA